MVMLKPPFTDHCQRYRSYGIGHWDTGALAKSNENPAREHMFVLGCD